MEIWMGNQGNNTQETSSQGKNQMLVFPEKSPTAKQKSYRACGWVYLRKIYSSC